WQGPAWLKQDEEHWPQNKVIIPQDTGEEKPPKKNVLMNCQSSPSFIDELIRRFSSYEKLIRTTAYILRFIKNSQSKSEEKKKGPIIIEEMTDARDLLIRHVQDQEYLEEIKRCKKGEQMPKDKAKN
uniref:Uncharacterized protein n=1 Tax=Phlebotomus papatasi TaxID=29031 RepID=A0A1B0D8P5_PHLPP